jgi:hypothetical protein
VGTYEAFKKVISFKLFENKYPDRVQWHRKRQKETIYHIVVVQRKLNEELEVRFKGI